jgi:hypothetical protein
MGVNEDPIYLEQPHMETIESLLCLLVAFSGAHKQIDEGVFSIGWFADRHLAPDD